jgi:glutamate racemase
VFTQPAPGLVELVEAGKVDGPEADGLLHCYLDPLVNKGVDTIVLGCTHYPFLRPAIERILGSKVLVIDTGEAVARQTSRVLHAEGLCSQSEDEGHEKFLTSGHVENVQPVVRRLWGSDALTVEHMTVS